MPDKSSTQQAALRATTDATECATRNAAPLLSPIRVAQILGVARSTISRAARGPLAPAIVDGRIDISNPAFEAWLLGRGQGLDRFEIAAPGVAGRKPEPDPTPEPIDDDGSPERMVSIQDLSLREIGQRFGSVEGFTNWLKMLKLAEDVRATRLRNDAASGDRVPWGAVGTHFLGGMEGLSRRLLGDVPKTMARQMYANERAGVPVETSADESTRLMDREISTTARRVRSALEKARNTKPQEGESTENADQN